MENYGNTAVKVLGKFHAFLCWKDKVYKKVFYVTDCDRSPNLLSSDACYTLGVLKPCHTMEEQLGVSYNSTHPTQSQVTCETWNYVKYSSPLVYSKFYSNDSKLCLAN